MESSNSNSGDVNEAESAFTTTIKEEIDEEEYQIEIEQLTEDSGAGGGGSIAIRDGPTVKLEYLQPEDGEQHASHPSIDAIPLTEYCRRTVSDNHPVGQKVRCGVCGLFTNVWARHKVVSVNYALQHVLSHMTIPCYRCKYCDFAAATPWNMPTHLRCHNLATSSGVHYTDNTSDHREEILEMLDLCYGTSSLNQRESKTSAIPPLVSNDLVASDESSQSDPSVEAITKEPVTNKQALSDLRKKTIADLVPPASSFRSTDTSPSLIDFCRTIIQDNFTSGQRATCSMCQSSFIRPRNKPIHSWLYQAFDHVLGHTNKSLFLCRQCDFGASSKSAMVVHMKTHSIIGALSDVHYTELLKIYEPMIKEIIRRCFSKSVPPQSNPTFKKSGKQQRKDYAPNVLCLQIADKVSRNGTMECLICSELIKVTNSRRKYFITEHAIDHALVHLGKEMYQCNRCAVKTILQHNMVSHRQETGHDYTDKSAMYQKEILDMLNRCYNPRNTDEDSKKKSKKSSGSEEKLGQSSRDQGNRNNSALENRERSFSRVTRSSLKRLAGESQGTPKIKRLAIVKFRNVPDGLLFCSNCFMITKHKKLLSGHMKVCRKTGH